MTDIRYAPDGAELHNSILDAPDEAILSWAFGHQWQPELRAGERKGYNTQVRDVYAVCPCGRKRHDVISKSGHLYSRDYSQGHKLRTGRVDIEEARAEWSRRERAKARRAAKRGGGQTPPAAASGSTTTAAEAFEGSAFSASAPPAVFSAAG